MQKAGKNPPKTIFLVKNNKSFRKKYEKMAHLAEKMYKTPENREVTL